MLTLMAAGEGLARTPNIVLVHGFSGWGGDELRGVRYWGGPFFNVASHLVDQGCVVRTASVGPLSSNHDRACELYAQLRGVRVNYGAAHAAAFGHEALGRDYSGGTAPVWDEAHPIDLVCHSQGGQTARLLVRLLKERFFAADTNARWVRSVTTISTPHRGTTIASTERELVWNQLDSLAAKVLFLTGSNLGDYDFDLGHWGLTRRSGETLSAFLARARSRWGSNSDVATYDLTPTGAAALNERAPLEPDVYYLSWSNAAGLLPQQLFHGGASINPVLLPFYGIMTERGPSGWRTNDGVVNTISMSGPSDAQIRQFDETLIPGVFNHMDTLYGMDHARVIGWTLDAFSPLLMRRLRALYGDIARHLHSLP